MHIKIKISKFFAELEWILWKVFKRYRKIPCGRTRRTSYLCCNQPFKDNRCFWSDDRKTIFCKCCGSIRIQSPVPIKSVEGDFL